VGQSLEVQFCIKWPAFQASYPKEGQNHQSSLGLRAKFWPLTKPGLHQIASDWIGLTKLGLNKTRIRLNSIKKTHTYSVKVGAFQAPTKNGQVVSLD